MTTVTQLQQADADVLKCIFFNLLSDYTNILWYGLNCNIDEHEQKLNTIFTYLTLIPGCTLSINMECEIKSFIKRNSHHCVYTNISCMGSVIPVDGSNQQTEINFLITESGDIITTQNENKFIV